MRRLRLLVVLVLTALPVRAAGGQGDSLPPPAFSRVELARFGAVVGLGGLAYLADDAVRGAIRGSGAQESEFLSGLAELGNFHGQPGVLGLGLVMWGGGWVTRRPTVAASGLRALEAITVSGMVTRVAKELAGRARPDVPPNDRNDWQFSRGARTTGGDYEAMASGHATAAFAFAAAVTGEVALRAPEHTRLVGITTYGLAAVTAYARMYDDRHWLSDVTVGAGIGVVTGWAITRWHATRPDNFIDRLLLRPSISAAPDGTTRLGITVLTR